MSWNEGMLHHVSDDYVNDAPYGYSFAQSQDDPCVGMGCTVHSHPKPAKKHPMDYPVPSFGADPDMETTMKSLKSAETEVGHTLVMGTPESKAKWTKIADKDITKYNLNPTLDADVITSM
jgi:hypothetical protein